MRTLLPSVLVLMLVLVACGDGEDASPTASGAAPSPTSAATASVETPPVGETATAAAGGSPVGTAAGELPGPVRAAVAAAAKDEGVTEDEVVLVRWWYEEFESSALGCPKQDMLYLPVITPGYVVELEVDGRRLEYHTNLDNVVVRCPDPPQP